MPLQGTWGELAYWAPTPSTPPLSARPSGSTRELGRRRALRTTSWALRPLESSPKRDYAHIIRVASQEGRGGVRDATQFLFFLGANERS